jgi:type I restriction enzyme S subunit
VERYELPEGWRWGALGDNRIIKDIQPGFACGKKDVSDGIPHLRMNNVSKNGFLDMTLVRRIPKEKANSAGKWLEPGDIIFNNTNSTELVGKSCIFTGWQEPCTFSNHLTRLRANPNVLNREWLYVCLRELWLSGYFATNCVEFVGQSAFNKNKLKEIEIPIPPLAEQKRVVTRIEELTRRVEETRRLRREAAAEAGSFMQERIDRLLTGLTEKFSPLKQYLLGRPRNGWSPPGDSFAAKGVPVLTLSAVTGFKYDGTKVKWTASPTRPLAHYWLKPGELLITRSNTRELVGHAAIYDGTPAPCICPDLIMKMTADPEKAETRFIHYWLQTWEARNYLMTRARGTSGSMKKINQGHVENIPVPAVPVKEQRRIVEYLDSIQAKADELKRLQAETDLELATFTPALLSKAFRGEL